MKKINLEKKRLDILNRAKKHLIFDGWTDNIFKVVAIEKKI